MSSKLSKSNSASENSNNKATPKVFNRLTRGTPKTDSADSPPPLRNSRLSVDRSPRPHLSSKTIAVDRRSPKLIPSPEKQQPRVSRGSDLQARLSLIQEELKKAKEKLVLIEEEKAQAIEGLKEAQKSADEANEKLREAHVAQKQAEENSEIEKFRATEMEQAAIDSTRKKEEEWQKELEAVRNQHALDVAALLSATEELKQDRNANLTAKNQAISHADDLSKVAEAHAQKAEALSAELAQLKVLLDSKLENVAVESTQLLSELNLEIETLKKELRKANDFEQKLTEKEACIEKSTHLMSDLSLEIEMLKKELKNAKAFEQQMVEKEACIEKSTQLVSKLSVEMDFLKQELEKAKAFEQKLVEKEACIEQSNQLVSELDIEIETLKQELKKAKSFEKTFLEIEACNKQLDGELRAAKIAESHAYKLTDEWQKKAKDLEERAKETNRLERSASESLESIMKQLEGSNDLLHDAESEISSLKEKVGLLEISINRQRGDLEESERQLSAAKEKTAEMMKKAESMEYELENLEEEKNLALNNEKLAAESVQSLLEEKNKLINELEICRDEEEKSKKAVESLAAALHEVSLQAREAKEKLSAGQTEQENYENQIENLRLVLKATNEKYQTMLDDARHEIDILTDTIEQNKQEYQNSRTECEKKEVHMTNCVKKLEDENSSLEGEISRLVNLLKDAEEKAGATKEEGARLMKSLKEAESEVVYLKEIIGETKAESMKLKETLVNQENELQNVIEENEELRTREVATIEKVEELPKSLKEAENGELLESEKDNDLLLKAAGSPKQKGDTRENEQVELPPQQWEPSVDENYKADSDNFSDENVYFNTSKAKFLNGNQEDNESKEKEEGTMDVDVKMWEVFKNENKELSLDREEGHESLEEDAGSKVDDDGSCDQVNGLASAENVDNGGTSPLKLHQKKKKPIFQKFGSLLKKKGTTNQK